MHIRQTRDAEEFASAKIQFCPLRKIGGQNSTDHEHWDAKSIKRVNNKVCHQSMSCMSQWRSTGYLGIITK